MFVHSLMFISTITSFAAADQRNHGLSDVFFDDIIGSKMYIDKTMLIEHIMTSPAKNLVALAPGSFGKTTNLIMLRRFLEVEVNSDGGILEPDATRYYRTFKEKKIGKRKDFFDEHFARYPVIQLNLAELNVTGTYQAFRDSFRRIMTRLYSIHGYLSKAKDLSEVAKKNFSITLASLKDVNVEPDFRCAEWLSQLLHRFTHQRCILLIDEFDTPYLQALLGVPGMQDIFKRPNIADVQRFALKDLTDFLGSLLGRDNKHIRTAFLTGVTRFKDSESGAFFDDLKYQSVLENDALSQFFGFTEEDVDFLATTAFGKPELLKEAKKWYGGYRVMDSGKRRILFNSQSILKFFVSGGKVGPYWEASPSIGLKEFFHPTSFGDLIERSLTKEILFRPTDRINREKLVNLRGVVDNVHSPEDFAGKLKIECKDMLFQLFLENGYFTAAERSSLTVHRIVVPNQEVRSELEKLLFTETYFKTKLGIMDKDIREYAQSLAKLDVTETSLRDLIKSILKLFNAATPQNEDQLQTPLYSIPKLVKGFFRDGGRGLVENPSLGDKKRFLLLHRIDQATVLMAAKFDQDSGRDVVKQILESDYYKEKERQRSFDPTRILIGLTFNRLKGYSLSCLFNSTNIEDAVVCNVQGRKRRKSHGEVESTNKTAT